MDEEKKEELVVGTIPGNTQLLSALSESDPELAEDITYLMGGVECYKDINQRSRFPIAISTEEFGIDLKAIIKRILKYLENLARDVFDGSVLGAMAIEGIVSRGERVMVDGRSKRRNHNKTDFIIDTRIANLSVRYKAISDPQYLLQQLKIFGETVKPVLSYLTYGVFTSFESLINFDPMADSIDTLAQTVQASSPLTLKADARFTNRGFSVDSPQLLGCQKISVTNRRPDSAALEQILGCSMSLVPAENEPLEVKDFIKYDRFGVSLEQSLIREVINVASMISNTNTINRRSVRRNRSKLITARIQTLEALCENDSLNEDQFVNIRNYIRVLEVYAGWISSPYVALIALAHKNLTAILNVCEGNAK